MFAVNPIEQMCVLEIVVDFQQSQETGFAEAAETVIRDLTQAADARVYIDTRNPDFVGRIGAGKLADVGDVKAREADAALVSLRRRERVIVRQHRLLAFRIVITGIGWTVSERWRGQEARI